MLQTETTLPTDLSPLALFAQAIGRVRRKGFASTISRMSFLAYELYWERRFGIDTADCIPREMLSDDPASIGYDPIGYRQLSVALKHADLSTPTGTFLDYGCGKGRVLARASVLPFEKIVGVELSSDLCDAAQSNIEQLSSRSRCTSIEVVHANASVYVVPNDTRNIFLFNPFTRHILEDVVEQIRQSLEREPRDLTVLYILPPKSKDIFEQTSWMAKTAHHSWSGLKLCVHRAVPTHFEGARF
jgi:SAM-dependent methyltransferase